MGNVERSNAGSGVHWAPCGCDSARRLEAVGIDIRSARDVAVREGLPMDLCAELTRIWERTLIDNPPPPASTAPDQGQGDSCDGNRKIVANVNEWLAMFTLNGSPDHAGIAGITVGDIEDLMEIMNNPEERATNKIDALNADEDRMVELEGALEFYADNDNWERFSDGGGGHMPSDAMIDEGEVARRALEVKP